MDKDDVEYMVTLYKYLHDRTVPHDENWERNMPQPKPKFREKEQSNISSENFSNNEVIKTKDDIKCEETKETDKEDIKKTLNFLKLEIERIENLIK